MQARDVEELCAIARAGGSLVLHADVRPVEELEMIAKALRPGAHLTLQATAFRPIQELCRVAEAAPGQITFVG